MADREESTVAILDEPQPGTMEDVLPRLAGVLRDNDIEPSPEPKPIPIQDDFDPLAELADALDRERELEGRVGALERQLDAARLLAEQRKVRGGFLLTAWQAIRQRIPLLRGVPVFPNIIVRGRESLTEEQATDLRDALDGFGVPHTWLPYGPDVTYYDKQGNMHVLQPGAGVIVPPTIDNPEET